MSRKLPAKGFQPPSPLVRVRRRHFVERLAEDKPRSNGPVLNICLLSYYHFSSSTSCRIDEPSKWLALSKGLERGRPIVPLHIPLESRSAHSSEYSSGSIYTTPHSLMTYRVTNIWGPRRIGNYVSTCLFSALEGSRESAPDSVRDFGTSSEE